MHTIIISDVLLPIAERCCEDSATTTDYTVHTYGCSSNIRSVLNRAHVYDTTFCDRFYGFEAASIHRVLWKLPGVYTTIRSFSPLTLSFARHSPPPSSIFLDR
jgi:hypothetical protein